MRDLFVYNYMKGTLILAILIVAIHPLSLTNSHQAHIFNHQNALNTQPATSTPTIPQPSPTTAQTNPTVTTPTQPLLSAPTAPAAPAAPAAPITPTVPTTPPAPITPTAPAATKSVAATVPKSVAPAAPKVPVASKPIGKVPNKNANTGNRGKTGFGGRGIRGKKPAVAKPTGPFFSNELTLTFDYATREQTCFYSAHLEVYWNGQKVKQIIPTDYDVHSMSFKLTAKPGKNVLAFAGAGISDGRGATLTNVKIIRKSSFGLQDLVQNGDFKQGSKGIWNSKIFKKSYPGWKGKQIQIGKGDFYNKNWNGDLTVTELDANQNTRIQQSFYFLDNYQVFYEVDLKDLAA